MSEREAYYQNIARIARDADREELKSLDSATLADVILHLRGEKPGTGIPTEVVAYTEDLGSRATDVIEETPARAFANGLCDAVGLTENRDKVLSSANLLDRTYAEGKNIDRNSSHDLLAVIDHLARAMGDTGDYEVLRTKLEEVYQYVWQEFQVLLELPHLGENFNPRVHYAVGSASNLKYPSGSIVQVKRLGISSWNGSQKGPISEPHVVVNR